MAATTEAGERFPGFDGLRAIAAVVVVLTHVSFVTTANRQWGGSYLARLDSGVAIFFVISGFLLYRPFMKRLFDGAPAPHLGAYAARRALRIYPAYWIAAIAIGIGFGVKPWTGVGDAATHLALLHIYDPDTVVSGPISQAWSLGTEVSFYVALPALAWVARAVAARTDRRIGPQLAFVGALVAAGLAYRWIVASSLGEAAPTYLTWLPGSIDQFGLGMGLAVLSAHGSARALDRRFVAGASWAAAFACLTAAAFWIGLPTSTLGYSAGQLVARQVAYGLFGAFLVLPAVFGPQRGPAAGPVRRLLASPPLRLLGLVSYGIYLWHQFFVDRFLRWSGTPEFGGRFWPAVAVVFAGAVAVATVSYVLAERPLLALGRRLPSGRRPVAPPPVPSPSPAP